MNLTDEMLDDVDPEARRTFLQSGRDFEEDPDQPAENLINPDPKDRYFQVSGLSPEAVEKLNTAMQQLHFAIDDFVIKLTPEIEKLTGAYVQFAEDFGHAFEHHLRESADEAWRRFWESLK